MSDMVRSLDNVIICIEPGNHEESVSPRVANYIGQLQRENAQLRKYVARLAEANGAAAVARGAGRRTSGPGRGTASMKNEYRVVWRRAGGQPHKALYATLKGAQRKVLRLGPEPWLAALESRQRDPDSPFCCGGYQCGCGGFTVRENWQQFMAQHPPIVDGPRIESRHVGTWTPERGTEGEGLKP